MSSPLCNVLYCIITMHVHSLSTQYVLCSVLCLVLLCMCTLPKYTLWVCTIIMTIFITCSSNTHSALPFQYIILLEKADLYLETELCKYIKDSYFICSHPVLQCVSDMHMYFSRCISPLHMHVYMYVLMISLARHCAGSIEDRL